MIINRIALTMIDGKDCSAITSTLSTQRLFYLCLATSKLFNDIDAILQKEVKEDHVQFGLSILHAWIRFLSALCIYHAKWVQKEVPRE